MHSDTKTLTKAERELLLHLARAAIRNFLAGGASPALDEAILSPALRAPSGCFVTLHKQGELRGCIGILEPREPLFRAVLNNATGAAFRDTRFSPVDCDELPALEIEISVLTRPREITFDSPSELLRQLRPGVDGVVLKMEGRTATFLPQVWGKLPDAANFMDALAHKAMLPASAWRDSEAVVQTYQVESFSESEQSG